MSETRTTTEPNKKIVVRFSPAVYKDLLQLCEPGETVNKAVKRRLLQLVAKPGTKKPAAKSRNKK